MKTRYLVMLLMILVVAVVIVGYTRNAAQKPTSSPGDVRQVDGVVLPEWAPENPSPEFLRAAKVLKPMPTELLEMAFGKKGISKEAQQLVLQRYTLWWLSAWEFFGTLSDRQIQALLSQKRIQIRISDLTPEQRKNFDKFIDSWDKALGNRSGGISSDIFIVLYKSGAKEDLSNVDIGFQLDGSAVHILFWIHTPQGVQQSWSELCGMI